ncbi:MAG: hypothetical protein KGL39_16840 [Patescibacteria group bacterium]|nr:hypothetical protein [Patescibacteria group bacterium]
MTKHYESLNLKAILDHLEMMARHDKAYAWHRAKEIAQTHEYWADVPRLLTERMNGLAKPGISKTTP